MSMIELQVRYFQDSTPTNVSCREENFVRRQIKMPLPLAQTALILVDVWNVDFIESWIERAKKIPRTRLYQFWKQFGNVSLMVNV